MSYKIVIVDDEEIMRDGLASLINWESMGYEVIAKFEDGQDAIHYIKNNLVDVVLTDIKMNYISGLDLAKYIHENKLITKIVLISAHKEFELAQNAIAYNVYHYLLKPVILSDMYNVFRNLKLLLDHEHEKQKEEIQKQNKIDELLILSRKQFFYDMAMITFKDQQEVLDRIKPLGLNIDPGNSACCNLKIELMDYENFINNIWGYSREGLYNAVINFFTGNSNKVMYFHVGIQKNTIQLIAVDISGEASEFQRNLEVQLNEVQQGVKTFIGLEICISINEFFNSILDMALSQGTKEVKAAAGRYDSEIQNSLENKIAYKAEGSIDKSQGDVIWRIKNYINEHIGEDITLEDIADFVYLSPVYLSRIFKEKTGENFSDYIIKTKLDKAKELLRNPMYKVYEVSSIVGYSSIKYFYRLFKKYARCTPTEYRSRYL